MKLIVNGLEQDIVSAPLTPLLHVLGFVAVVFGAANVFGGFFVTDRMLEMFKGRQAPKTPESKTTAK